MDKAEANRRATFAKTMQKAISWQLEHNAEMYERAKGAAYAEGNGVRATLLDSGNVLLVETTEVPAGELEWATVIGHDES